MTDMPPYLAARDEDSGQGDSDASSDVDDWDLPLSYNKLRHHEPIVAAEREEHSWRVKEKYKTHCVALVLCLNVNVDPPDVIKTQPCARLECWIDPVAMSTTKALESIGQALQSQYERWQPRARYKQTLDPTSEDVKKLCCSLRRNAKDERVLFHYNGHGVPKPTAQGEIWVFNRSYTQYIPLSMYDLQTWMGAPSLYVYDCSNAGVIIDNFKLFAEQHEKEYQKAAAEGAAGAGGAGGGGGGGGGSGSGSGSGSGAVSYRNCIQLAACAGAQTLPQNAELPADLFTACLTTPVKMAMKWFVLRNKTRIAPPDVYEYIDKIPGLVTDRRSMLGELNWIFTAITDTIAWSSLPAELFQRLFRADLLTASLCRNFLLADRIMRSYNCTPVSSPALPSLAAHPLWLAWDHALELALAQLPHMLGPAPQPYRHSPFFRDQLTAFQVWLDLGERSGSTPRPPPDQLPMVLQVLLSTLHRVRALQILCRFLALGSWAVKQVLAVGIFPYMLKLLQASANDLRASMVYIWAKIIAVDPSCQVDLVNARGHKYFLSVLQDTSIDSEHRTLAAYVLAGIVDNYRAGQDAALQVTSEGSMISFCLEQVTEGCVGLAAWSCLALGRAWRQHEQARAAASRDLAHEKLFPLLRAAVPELRAAAAFALGTLVAAGAAAPPAHRAEHADRQDKQVARELADRLRHDCAVVVRAEILAALQWLVLIFEQNFIAVHIQEQERLKRTDRDTLRGGRVDPGQDALGSGRAGADTLPRRAPQPLPAYSLPTIGFGSVYMKLWRAITAMAKEPHPQISQMATDIINYISNQLDSATRDAESGASGPRSGGGAGGAGGGGGNSFSLPPSPNTRGLPAERTHTHTLPQPGRRGRPGLPATISEDSMSHRSERDSTSSTSSHTPKKPIVSTQFVEWMSAQYARADPLVAAGQEVGAGSAGGSCPGGEAAADWRRDCESRARHERGWRYARNRSLRREARALRLGRVSRLETQVFHSRCSLPPGVLVFHPYEQHAAVAFRDNFGVWDWGTGAKLAVGAWRAAWGRVAALRYLDAHDHALLAVASHTGNVAIFRPAASGTKPTLVTAWRALHVRVAQDYRPPPAQPLYSLVRLFSDQLVSAGARRANAQADKNRLICSPGGSYSPPPPPTLTAWCQRRRSLAVAGLADCVRLWDADTELLHAEIDTKCEAGVTSLWRGGGGGSCGAAGAGAGVEAAGAGAGAGCAQLVCGFGDGSVRAWDERAPPAPLYALHEHAAPVLCAARRHDLHTMITVCMNGEVRVYDTRRLAVVETARAPGPLAAVDVHPLYNLLACGSVNQCISIFDLKGSPLNTIKFHEGFMGARIGPVSCLTFHPLRCAMGVGSKDSSVSVYVAEPRR